MTYQLIHGDCLDVLPTLEAGSVDAVITDPPYGIGYESSWKTRLGGGERVNRASFGADVFDSRWIQEAHRVLREDAYLYCFSRWDVLNLWVSEFKECGFVPVQRLIWDKCHWKMGDLENYGSQTEDVILLRKGRPSMFAGGQGRRGNMFRFSSAFLPEGQYDHPTQKPVNLLRRYIVDSTQLGATILDPFMGSGSTIVAAIMEGRNAIGIEIDKGYYDIACRRCADAAAQPRLLDVEPAQPTTEQAQLFV